jgi:hypothetical protein
MVCELIVFVVQTRVATPVLFVVALPMETLSLENVTGAEEIGFPDVSFTTAVATMGMVE